MEEKSVKVNASILKKSCMSQQDELMGLTQLQNWLHMFASVICYDFAYWFQIAGRKQEIETETTLLSVHYELI